MSKKTINGLNIEDWFRIALAKEEALDAATVAIEELADAIRLTVEYIGNDNLPPLEGWSWFDALSKYRPEWAEQFVRNPILFHAKSVPVPASADSGEAER